MTISRTFFFQWVNTLGSSRSIRNILSPGKPSFPTKICGEGKTDTPDRGISKEPSFIIQSLGPSGYLPREYFPLERYWPRAARSVLPNNRTFEFTGPFYRKNRKADMCEPMCIHFTPRTICRLKRVCINSIGFLCLMFSVWSYFFFFF